MAKFRGRKLGKIVAHFRIKAGLSEDDLAEKMGISKSMISQIENGHVSLTEGALEAFLLAVDITPLEFFAIAWELTDFAKPKPALKEVKKLA